jgi:hypothetical protein
LCIIHPPFLYVRAEIPLSLPVPTTQHTPGPELFQYVVIHSGAVGESNCLSCQELGHNFVAMACDV